MMYEQILDSYRKAAESTMQMQQMMLRNMTQQWPAFLGAGGMQPPGAAWMEQAQAMQRKWSEAVTSMLNKHRETLDAQYRAGIKTIEEAFRVGEARDVEHFRKLTEELWKHSFEALKTVTEEQIKEVQDAMQKFMELASETSMARK